MGKTFVGNGKLNLRSTKTLLYLGGRGGGGRERYFENCAYLWKNPGLAPGKSFFCFMLFVLEATNENASALLYRGQVIACVASVSVRFRSK